MAHEVCVKGLSRLVLSVVEGWSGSHYLALNVQDGYYGMTALMHLAGLGHPRCRSYLYSYVPSGGNGFGDFQEGLWLQPKTLGPTIVDGACRLETGDGAVLAWLEKVEKGWELFGGREVMGSNGQRTNAAVRLGYISHEDDTASCIVPDEVFVHDLGLQAPEWET